MKANLFAVLGVVLLTLPPPIEAQPQDAPPPIGLWKGSSPDGRVQVMMALGANGDFMGEATGARPVAGHWLWEPTVGGGFLTIRSRDGGRRNSLFYSITYRDANTLTLSEPGAWYTLVRQ